MPSPGLGSQLLGRPRPTSGKANGSKPAGAFSGQNLGGTLSGLAEGLSAVAAGWSPNPETRQMFAQIASEHRNQREARRQQRLEIALSGFDQIEKLLTNAPEMRGTQSALDMVDRAEKVALVSGGDEIPGLTERVQTLRQFAQTPAAAPEQEFVTKLRALGDLGIDLTPEQVVKGAGFDLPPEQLGTLAQKVADLKAQGVTPTPEQMLQMAGAVQQGQEFSFEVDPTTGRIGVRMGTGAASGGGPTFAQGQVHNERLDQFSQLEESLNQLVQHGESEGSQFGAVATVGKAITEVGRVAGEAGEAALPEPLGGIMRNLGKVAGDVILSDDNIDPVAKAELMDQMTLGGLEAEEAKLAYLYARTVLQPDDRLLKDTLEAARKSTRLFTIRRSEKTILETLRQIQKGLARAKKGVQESIPTTQPSGSAAQPSGDILGEARAAIAGGADPEAVKKRLRELGGDPGQL